jgi:hypothetical protein
MPANPVNTQRQLGDTLLPKLGGRFNASVPVPIDLDFEFGICFEFRISSFEFFPAPCAPSI